MKDAEKVSNVKAWVKPRTVVEVKYYGKSRRGVFRFPDFLRVRTDKKPRQCWLRKA